MKRHIYGIETLLITLGLLFSASIHAGERLHLRGERYCEILTATSPYTLHVYNTLNLNTCPEDIWRNISKSSVKHEKHVLFAILNGPRYWTIDGIKHAKLINNKVETINGLALREAGVLHLGVKDWVTAKLFYREHVVQRDTVFIFDAGKPVYELISPNGSVYVMQSYKAAHGMNQDKLAHLGQLLTLPSGWKFKTGNTTKEESVDSQHQAVVIQDNFENTYEKAAHDLL